MLKKTETPQENLIEVLTSELIESLDVSVKENIVLLSERIGDKAMLPLNPLVTRFQTLLEYNDLKYNSEKKKESVQDYKDAKADIRNFRATVKATKTEMKAKIIETGKAMDNIEKTFVDKATEIHDVLDVNFNEYLEEEKKKVLEAARKKEEARNAVSLALQKEAEETLLKAQKSGAMSKVKYDMILAFKEEKTNELSRLNISSIDRAIELFKQIKIPVLLTKYQYTVEWSLLEDDQQMELIGLLRNSLADLGVSYSARKDTLEEDKARELSKAIEEQNKVVPTPTTSTGMHFVNTSSPPPPPKPLKQNAEFSLSSHSAHFKNQVYLLNHLRTYNINIINNENPPHSFITLAKAIDVHVKEITDILNSLIK